MKMYELAQINIAHLKASLDSPLLAEFVHFLEPVNALAEQSPGFVWRMKDEDSNNATTLETPFSNPQMVANMSVWEDLESLKAFAFHTAHSYFVRNGQRWFHKMKKPHLVLWWIPKGHEPTQAEAKEKLDLIEKIGPTAAAFNFGRAFYPDGRLMT